MCYLSNTLNNRLERCKRYGTQIIINFSVVLVFKKFSNKNCNSRLHIEKFHDLYSSPNILVIK